MGLNNKNTNTSKPSDFINFIPPNFPKKTNLFLYNILMLQKRTSENMSFPKVQPSNPQSFSRFGCHGFAELFALVWSTSKSKRRALGRWDGGRKREGPGPGWAVADGFAAKNLLDFFRNPRRLKAGGPQKWWGLEKVHFIKIWPIFGMPDFCSVFFLGAASCWKSTVVVGCSWDTMLLFRFFVDQQ